MSVFFRFTSSFLQRTIGALSIRSTDLRSVLSGNGSTHSLRLTAGPSLLHIAVVELLPITGHLGWQLTAIRQCHWFQHQWGTASSSAFHKCGQSKLSRPIDCSSPFRGAPEPATSAGRAGHRQHRGTFALGSPPFPNLGSRDARVLPINGPLASQLLQ